ncbi:MAG TPA: hypothetical protein VKR53_10070 [Puia sp.]|nr:hypothetical protein [Puia sp.]
MYLLRALEQTHANPMIKIIFMAVVIGAIFFYFATKNKRQAKKIYSPRRPAKSKIEININK